MFSGLPTASRRLVKGQLALAWALAGGAGLSSVLLLPGTFVRELGVVLTLIFGTALAVASTVAVIGVVAGHYRLEWTASYLASASTMPYVGTLWAAVALGHVSTLPQAFLVTALVAFFALRGLLCAAHAALLRDAHTMSAAVGEVLTEGEGTADGPSGVDH